MKARLVGAWSFATPLNRRRVSFGLGDLDAEPSNLFIGGALVARPEVVHFRLGDLFVRASGVVAGRCSIGNISAY
jgi:hypothetical protein